MYNKDKEENMLIAKAVNSCHLTKRVSDDYLEIGEDLNDLSEEEFFELLFHTKEVVVNSKKREKVGYIIFPKFFEKINGYRLKKLDRDGKFIIVKKEDMTEEERQMLDIFDMKYNQNKGERK